MENKQAQVLRELINSVDQREFDLEVWKMKASLVVGKIFGLTDVKLGLIDELHYDYSSWSLRDRTGGKQIDLIKIQAKGILETALLEISLDQTTSPIVELIQNQLTGAEMHELENILNNKASNESNLTEYFSKIAPSKKDGILAQILLLKNE